MTVTYPQLFGLVKDKIGEKIYDLQKLGYEKEVIIKILLNQPQVLCYGIENIKNKINDLMSLGFTKEQILKMTSFFPKIYSLSISKIKDTINTLEQLGFTKEETIKMIYELPTLLGYEINNIIEKVSYIISIGLKDSILKNPKNLMQSAELTEARDKYLTEELNLDINDKNYILLFRCNNIFKNKFNITKEELLKKYNQQSIKKSKR